MDCLILHYVSRHETPSPLAWTGPLTGSLSRKAEDWKTIELCLLYYKQATVGSCEIPRPGFWDPIGRYKWDAWNRLGKMSKEEAMAAYISEMKKVAQKVQSYGVT
uniref:Acyl-CoA binding domain containing 4 n=1 Tax=Chelonoidis abingdonii TaxID=106734 RepID=A0A8C0GGW6_CHEAB